MGCEYTDGFRRLAAAAEEEEAAAAALFGTAAAAAAAAEEGEAQVSSIGRELPSDAAVAAAAAAAAAAACWDCGFPSRIARCGQIQQDFRYFLIFSQISIIMVFFKKQCLGIIRRYEQGQRNVLLF